MERQSDSLPLPRRTGLLHAWCRALPAWLRQRRDGMPSVRVVSSAATPRFEVRVCFRGNAWEVHLDSDGGLHRHADAIAALRDAHAIAQRTWSVEGRESAVKLLSPAGNWEVDMVFGIAP